MGLGLGYFLENIIIEIMSLSHRDLLPNNKRLKIVWGCVKSAFLNLYRYAYTWGPKIVSLVSIIKEHLTDIYPKTKWLLLLGAKYDFFFWDLFTLRPCRPRLQLPPRCILPAIGAPTKNYRRNGLIRTSFLLWGVTGCLGRWETNINIYAVHSIWTLKSLII